MKKYTIGLLSVLALVAIATAPTSAASAGGVVKCNKRAAALAKVPTDLEFFKATYYTMPSAEEIAAHYQPVSIVSAQRPIAVPTAIFRGDGPKSRVGKTNYALVAKRFHDTQTYFSSIVLKDTATPALNADNLNKLIAANAAIDASIANHIEAIDNVKAAYPVAATDCKTAAGQAAVNEKYNQKVGSFKVLNQDIVLVRNKTKESRAVYQKLESQRFKLDRQHKI